MSIAQLGRIPKAELTQKRNEFLMEKMKLDKFFSVFLEEHNLDMEEHNSKNWLIYKQKLAEYQLLNQKIKWSDYYLSR